MIGIAVIAATIVSADIAAAAVWKGIDFYSQFRRLQSIAGQTGSGIT